MTKISDFIDAEVERIEALDGNRVADNLDIIAQKVAQKYGHKCAVEYIGGFDSPGYGIDCYALAYVEDGEVKIYAHNEISE
ncbi:hypothetical protein [Sporosarcina psychrophila]|uniref:ThiF/HesA family dinucleotide-utilizing enzyme n=1 Tax=Sporosarcina psychrophila TaxID=1476 RepID=A0ABV2KBM7_SPOPS